MVVEAGARLGEAREGVLGIHFHRTHTLMPGMAVAKHAVSPIWIEDSLSKQCYNSI
jgi:hypothetical protein